ncbi:prepilin-type N-terminal cleavage/methylation domain-containing protein [Candidatus Poribacteria bacterium]|nr:prepilin-type N-terminal cleavage/methylation domain-containing protein [Candidatus Poribacteria bacterium]
MKGCLRNERGLTLLELLIAVAIIVIIAGVGIPTYLKFRSTSQHAEANLNLNGIKQFEESYKLGNGIYINCAVSPRPVAALDETTLAWTDLGIGFTSIGFGTNAPVRFVYAVTGATTTSFLAEAAGDTNRDGNDILFVASPTIGPRVVQLGDAVTLGADTQNID